MTARRRVAWSWNCGASPLSTAIAAGTALCMLLSSAVSAPAQDPAPQPQPPFGPVEGIQLLLEDVDLLLQDGTLKPSAHKHLVRSLEDAQLSLYGADPAAANDAMDEFATRTERLLRQGALDEKQALRLMDLGKFVDQEILKLSQPLPLQLRCAGKLPVVYVDDDAGAGGDGSAARPFQRLNDALDYAAETELSGIEIHVALGFYEEHLEITRHTRIVGTDAEIVLPVLAGSIHNFGPYCLEISGLEITDATEGPAGAVYVSHEEAFTSLSRVFILDATGFGLIQHGGLLAMESCVIDRTVPLAEPVGVAMHLSGGIQAELQRVLLTRNRGGGLVVTGAGTNVFAELLTIDGTEINPYSTDRRPFSQDLQLGLLEFRLPGGIMPRFDVPPGRAALDVRNGAAFFGRLLEVLDNEYAGVFVAHSASAQLEYAYVGRTDGVEQFPDAPAGHNVFCTGAGAVQMRYFLVERADLCGFMIGPEAQVDLLQGVVARNTVGVCLQADGYDVSRLMNDVLYSDNGTTLEATSFPVPEAADPVAL